MDQRKTLEFRVLMRPEPEGGFTVTVPDLPGCVTHGDNTREALRMAKEAIECHLEAMIADGEPIPGEASIEKFVRVAIACE